MDDFERTLLRQALQSANFNVNTAATQLGLSVRQIRTRMTRLQVHFEQDMEHAKPTART